MTSLAQYMTYFNLRKKNSKLIELNLKDIVKNQNRFCVTID